MTLFYILLAILVRRINADSHAGNLANAIAAMGAVQHCDVQVAPVHEILLLSGVLILTVETAKSVSRF